MERVERLSSVARLSFYTSLAAPWFLRSFDVRQDVAFFSLFSSYQVASNGRNYSIGSVVMYDWRAREAVKRNPQHLHFTMDMKIQVSFFFSTS